MENEMQEITIKLAGKGYPIVATQAEVKVLEEIALQLNKEFDELSSAYASKLIKQDILAMLLITYAKKLADQQASQKQMEQLHTQVDNILDVLSLTSSEEEA